MYFFFPGHHSGVYSYDLQVHRDVSVFFKLVEFFDHAPDCSFEFCALGFISVILMGGGHFYRTRGCGQERAHCLGLSYCFSCDLDLWASFVSYVSDKSQACLSWVGVRLISDQV